MRPVAGAKATDAGKKVSGIKRHIGVDTQGLAHEIHLIPANETDRAGALPLLERLKESLPRLEKVLVDEGYRGPALATTVATLTGCQDRVKESPLDRDEKSP